MTLRAKPPGNIEKKLKVFMHGGPGVGKTFASIQFPNSYDIDCEHGTETYSAELLASGSAVFHTTALPEIIQEVRGLLTEQHDYRTLIIDPITIPFDDLLDQAAAEVGEDFGRHHGRANREMKRLARLILQLDMNVVVTAHAKPVYGPNLTLLGQTFDGWKRLEYLFDLVVELKRDAKGRRIARVAKSRIPSFKEGEEFEWSFAAVKERWERFAGVGALDRAARVVELATAEQVAELEALLARVRLPEGTPAKWLAKAGVDEWEDMPRAAMAACIQYVKDRERDGGRGGDAGGNGASTPPPPTPATPAGDGAAGLFQEQRGSAPAAAAAAEASPATPTQPAPDVSTWEAFTAAAWEIAQAQGVDRSTFDNSLRQAAALINRTGKEHRIDVGTKLAWLRAMQLRCWGWPTGQVNEVELALGG